MYTFSPEQVKTQLLPWALGKLKDINMDFSENRKQDFLDLYKQACDEELIKVQKAVCVLTSLNDKIVCVSRKNDFNSFGFVGGKVDENESIMDAAKREFFEETGIDVFITSILSFDFDDTATLTYFTSARISSKQLNNFYLHMLENEISYALKNEGLVRLLTEEELLANTPYPEYNKKMLELYHICYGFT